MPTKRLILRGPAKRVASAASPGHWLFASLRGFRLSWVSGDAVAGMTLAAIAIPEQLATARLTGLPPESGLIAFAAGTLAFAAFGVNRHMSVGADSTIAPIVAGGLAVLATADAGHYASLAALLALMTGLVLLLAGVLRAGWIADLLSIPVTTGFLAGIAIHVAIGQLPEILGVPAAPGSLVVQLVGVVRQIPQANPYNLAIGLSVLAAILLAEHIDGRIPGALIALALAGMAVWYGDLLHHGVAALGALPLAMPSFALALPDWGELTRLIPVSLTVSLVCMMQTAAVVRSFPGPGAPESVSRDFAGVGAGNVLAALAGVFPVNASPPRTAVAAESGGRSQLSGLLAVAIIAGVVLLASRAFAYVPRAALSGVLLFIATRIVRVRMMTRIYRDSGWEILLVVASAALIVFLPIQTGMTMSIVLSLLHSIYSIARPACAVLAPVPGTTVWWSLPAGEGGAAFPGVLVFAPFAPVNFTNAAYVRERLYDAIAAMAEPCRLVVIEATGMIGLDFTGSQMLQEVIADLHRRDIGVAMARLESPHTQSAASRTGLLAALGEGRVFRTVADAVSTLDERPAAGRIG
jgi:SulP family sulfate permease